MANALGRYTFKKDASGVLRRLLAAVLLAALVASAPPAGADVVARQNVGDGSQLTVTFQPPTGWQRGQDRGKTIYFLPGVQGGHCALFFETLDHQRVHVDTDSSFFSGRWSGFLATSGGQAVRQSPESWGASTAGRTTWRMRAAEVGGGESPADTWILYLGVAQGARQLALYNCANPAVHQQVGPQVVEALKGLNIEQQYDSKDSRAPRSRDQCMARCDGPYLDARQSCVARCLSTFAE